MTTSGYHGFHNRIELPGMGRSEPYWWQTGMFSPSELEHWMSEREEERERGGEGKS